MPHAHPDPWSTLRRFTPARIALGRAGGSLPTAELLDFALAHAAARDAVHAAWDIAATVREVEAMGVQAIICKTQVSDRATYLQRPDRGARLDMSASKSLAASAAGWSSPVHVAIILSDGLSAIATQSHAPNLLRELLPLLRGSNIAVSPIILAPFARVAVSDEIGHALRARSALILLGERPGLGCPDSLGAYLVFNPKLGNTNAQRNCVSNIRPAGLPVPAAAATLHHLIAESLRLGISGVALKDERTPALPLPASRDRIE